jgi:hypothetical protein
MRAQQAKASKPKEVKEEVELDELNKSTLGSYVKKSADDLTHIQRDITSGSVKDPEYKSLSRMRKNRKAGIARAVTSLTKEQAEDDMPASPDEKSMAMNQAKFSDVLTHLNELYQVKPIIMGHSLGGTLAQRFALQEGNLEKISSVMAFNSPGITHSELQVWEKHLEQKPEDRSKAIVVNTSDDFVNPLAKKRFIGRKFLFTPTEQFKKIHGKTLLGRAGRLEEVSLEESFSSLKKTSEKVQRIAKNIIKFITYRFVIRVLTTFVLVVKAAILEICFYFGHTKDSFNKSRLSRQKEIESDTSLNRLEKIRKHQESCLTTREEYVKLLQNVEDLLHLIHSQTTTV